MYTESVGLEPIHYCPFQTLSLPYVIFLIFLLISAVLQIRFPHTLDRSNGLYCTFSGITFRRWSVPIFSVLVLVLMIGFEIAIAVRYYSARRRIVTSFPLASRSTSLGLVIRITLFNMYLFVTFGASVVFLSGKLQAWAYMIQAALPLVAFLLFATQKNVILAWCIWRKKRKEMHSDNSMPALRKPGTNVDMNINIAATTPGPPTVVV